MLISGALKKLAGVREALVGLGTPLNKEIAKNIGLSTPELEALSANDFFVAIDCENESDLDAALDKVEEMLNSKKQSGDDSSYRPASLESALKMDPELNMAVISTPGKYAAGVAMKCLENDINVLMFSDNVTIEEELDLKRYAAERGLLMMGPDCGTAIVNHVPLAFANVVRPGGIGIVAASGTGTQEVSSIIDQLGGGVSQVLGTGGRDLKKEIGGIMYTLALDALIEDEETKVIVMISKPPAKEIQTMILNKAKDCKKPCVVCFIGGDGEEAARLGLTSAVSLEDAAMKAVALLRGKSAETFEGFTKSRAEIDALVSSVKFKEGQKYFRGLYTGGTLCDEAMKLSAPVLGSIYSNIPLKPEEMLEDARVSREHTCLDYGDDAFTVGRPHPMIDPSLRAERILKEAADPQTAVILLDCVIGWGAHEAPAQDLAETIAKAAAAAKAAGREIAFVVSVCGTEADPQCLSASRAALENAGAFVMPSNAQAVRLMHQFIKRA